MDWSNERWVRLFTRDTPEWLCMDWQARALWPLLLRKVDRSGVLANTLGVRGVAVLVGLPVDVIEIGLAGLIADGCLQEHPLGFVVPNFIEAQETPQSDAQRQRESRERRRSLTKRDTASRNVTECHAVSRAVTRGHAASQPVTPDQTSPEKEEENLSARARAIPPSTEHQAGGSFTPEELARHREVGQVAEGMWQRVSESRTQIAAELGVTGILALPVLSPVHQPGSFRQLVARVREEGPSARQVCDHVHDVLCAQARATRDLEWLGEKAFLEGSWREARNASPDAPLPSRVRAGPRGSAERASEPQRRPPRTLA